MAYYQDVKKKKVSREEHLSRSWNEGEEGSRYHGKSSGDSRDRYQSDRFGKRSEGHGNYHDDKRPGYGRPFDAKRKDDSRSYGDKRDGRSFGDKRGEGRPFRPDARPFDDRPMKKPYGKDAGERSFHNDRFDHNEHHDRPFHDAPKPERRPAPTERPVRDINVNNGFDTPYTAEPENLLSGRNPIREALKSGRDIEKLLVAKGDLSGSAREIVAMAREQKIPVQVVDRTRLDEITKNHQGLLAFASAYHYSEVEEMLEEAKSKNEQPFLIMLDGVTDPHNLGAIIRTAACVGAHGVIVPERRAVGLTPAAVKASAGAVETIKVARVSNLTRTIEMLKKEGLWVYAADMVGEDYRTLKIEAPMLLIIGSEGEGISRLVLEQADYKVKLPMYGGVESLNASVAAGVLMYAAVRGRE